MKDGKRSAVVRPWFEELKRRVPVH